MIRTLIEYRIRKDKIDLVTEEIRYLVHFVMKSEPEILTYKVFQKPDKVSFVHFMTFIDERSQKSYQESLHTKFLNSIQQHCEVKPISMNLTLIKSNNA